jgi:hypothetical protein
MSERTVSVEVSGSFDFTIDDEAVSEWDGAKILEVLEARGKGNDVYTEDATMDLLLGHLGITLSVENRTMGTFDGWADFPSSAASGNPYGAYWHIESVHVSDPSPAALDRTGEGK